MAAVCRCFQRSSSRVLLLQMIVAVAVASFLFAGQHEDASAYAPWWVQNHQETQLWSGVDGGAVAFTKVPQWRYFMVVSPQVGKRLYVFNPLTKNYAYIDAVAVGPCGAPPASYGSGTQDAGSGVMAGSFSPWWVQNYQEAQLWSGPDAKAVSFGRVAQWSRFQVVAPQQGPRLLVFNPASDNYAYIDASAVGPSGGPVTVASSSGPAAGTTAATPATGAGATAQSAPAPGAVVAVQPGRKGPVLPPNFEPWWVSNYREAELWAGPEEGARSLGTMDQFRRFMVVEPQSGSRLHVWSPEKDVLGYVDARLVGPSGPSVWMEPHPTKFVRSVQLPARSVGDKAYVRMLPVYDDETEVRRAPNNTALFVKESVVASDGTEWYVVGDGEYIRASEVRLPRPLSGEPLQGRWIDADLSEPTMVTAYENGKVVYSAMAIKGVSGAPTPQGTFRILRRTADETMDSETIGIPRDSPNGYLLKNVLYTQYFTSDGASLHYNYWLGTFGYPGSHGCLGLSLEDSKWFWDWADIGTPVVVRSTGGNPGSWGIAAAAAAASDQQTAQLAASISSGGPR